MLTYLIGRRCDTLPHCVLARRSPGSHSIGGKSLVSLCYIFLPTSVFHPRTFPSRLLRVIWTRFRGADRLSAQFVCGWSDHLRASCHSLIMVTARHLQRERERPGALQSCSVLIIITEGKRVYFPECPNASACMCSHCALFRCDIGGTCVFCAVRGLGSELTGWK